MKAARKLETVTVVGTVREVREKSIALEPLHATRHSDEVWFARSQIVEADCDLDEVERGEEITIEIPAWLAEQKGVGE